MYLVDTHTEPLDIVSQLGGGLVLYGQSFFLFPFDGELSALQVNHFLCPLVLNALNFIISLLFISRNLFFAAPKLHPPPLPLFLIFKLMLEVDFLTVARISLLSLPL